jgi:excisionase family DNA binding protein
MTPQPDLVTVTQAAKDLGATRGMVHHHILTRRLPAVRVGRPFLIPREAVDQLRREREAIAERTKDTGS